MFYVCVSKCGSKLIIYFDENLHETVFNFSSNICKVFSSSGGHMLESIRTLLQI